ncbi:MAG TPA: hypothetical protein PLK35_01135 [Candidatus Moranbacteria bacterium]|nr:hypothetical protein [Candidatus Moranbacteria bacterium]
MYWIFLIIFIIAVLIPDIIRGDVNFLAEERAEEVAIFLMGGLAFLVFIRNELQLIFHRKARERDQKRIDQTVKDLVESYSYIGEVNRKMDMLMNIALGLSDRSILSKKREREIYESIITAANFLLKAESTCLRFINIKNGRTTKEIKMDGKHHLVKNEELIELGDDKTVKKNKGYIVIATSQKINNIRGFLIISDYDENEEKNPKNVEILKVFASQAIFLYSYINLDANGRDCPPQNN